jgi:hypothetical protein
MKALRRKALLEPDVKVHVPSLVDCGHTIIAVPVHIALYINEFHKRVAALNAENDALVQSAAAMGDSYKRRIHAITEENEALRQRLRSLESVRASVVDAFKRQGGILNPPPERLHPNALTDAQRQEAADEARYKRHLDGLGDSS